MQQVSHYSNLLERIKGKKNKKYGHVTFHERWPLLAIHSPVWQTNESRKNKVDAIFVQNIQVQKKIRKLSFILAIYLPVRDKAIWWFLKDASSGGYERKVLGRPTYFVWCTNLNYFIRLDHARIKSWLMSHILVCIYPKFLKRTYEIPIILFLF